MVYPILTEPRHPGEFVLWEQGGHQSRDNIIIVSGQGIVKAGTVLGKITASGKYAISAPAAADGSQTPSALNLYQVDATSADQPVSAITREAEINGPTITYHSTINTGPLVVAANNALLTQFIVVRSRTAP
jgi:hypothetical protein